METLLLCRTYSRIGPRRFLDKIMNVAEPMPCAHRFMPRSAKLGRIYSDNAFEIIKACQELHRTDDLSMPHRSDTNGIAERAAATLVHCGVL